MVREEQNVEDAPIEVSPDDSPVDAPPTEEEVLPAENALNEDLPADEDLPTDETPLTDEAPPGQIPCRASSCGENAA